MALLTLTGFRAFPGVADNPTQALVEHFAAHPHALPADTRLALLDVDYCAVGPMLDGLLADPPAALILTGFSAAATAITLEAQASGLCAADKPDICGFVAAALDHPPLCTALDLAHLHAVVEREAPCTISHDAGQYLCNYAYARALEQVARRGLPTQVLFVHVPAIAGTPLAETSAASLALEVMAAALARIAAELAYSPPL